MGIHDRDWQKHSGPVRRRGGGAQGSGQALQRMRGFNATTWIVIICAFVFIIQLSTQSIEFLESGFHLFTGDGLAMPAAALTDG